MISVILIWLYMIVTTFLLGYGILAGITYLCPYRIKKKSSYIMCGFAGAAVYAQFFSIFAPVGLMANLIMSGICLLIAVAGRKRLIKELHGLVNRKGILLLCLFVLYAYGTSRGIIHYDTGLYHAQSIRWIEEYGVVKGLGNLHCRLAYNSASFALSALYSMAFINGRSYHAAAGFLALIVASVCLEIFGAVRRKCVKVSDLARVMGLYYLFNIFDEMISPASDYFMVLTAFYIIIRFLDLLEAKEDNVCPYSLLCVLGVFLMTVKLSAALIILLVAKPAVMLIKDKKWKEILLFISLGIVTAAPYLIRNVMISGWLVYPFTDIDLFNVDWKIPWDIASYDAKEIQVWGRGYSDVGAYDRSIGDWLPEWFGNIGGLDRLLVVAAFMGVGVFLIRIVCSVVHETAKSVSVKRPFKASAILDRFIVEGVVSLSFLFWIVTSPLMRYGCVYVYLTAAVVWGNVYIEILQYLNVCPYDSGTDTKKTGFNDTGRILQKTYAACAGRVIQILCIAVTGLFLLYKTAAFVKEQAAAYVNDFWLCQKDYENYDTLSYEIDGYTFYYPVNGDRTGYESFPSSPARAKMRLRGDKIEDGFYYAE